MSKTTTPFWQAVHEIAALRVHIPEERRQMSGVREAMLRDVLPKRRGSGDSE